MHVYATVLRIHICICMQQYCVNTYAFIRDSIAYTHMHIDATVHKYQIVLVNGLRFALQFGKGQLYKSTRLQYFYPLKPRTTVLSPPIIERDNISLQPYPLFRLIKTQISES